MSFEILISQNKNKFVEKDLELIEYLRKHSDNINNLNIQKVSEDISVSFTTIYNFLKKIGLKKFKDLLILISKSSSDQLQLDKSNSKFNISDIYKEIIQNNEQVLNQDALEKTISYIKSSSSIVFVGLGESHLFSRSLSNRLQRMGIKSSVAQTDAGMLLVKSNLTSKGDLLICVSVSGESSIIVEAAKIAKKNGATVVSICGSNESSLKLVSDVYNTIYFDAKSKLTEIMINPLSSLCWFSDILTQKLIEKNSSYLVKYRTETNKLISKNTKINKNK